MKEATGEVSMTVITIVAIAVIGGILAASWGTIRNYVNGAFGSSAGNSVCEGNQKYDPATGTCK